jgi:ABC-2 type transport system permease protein
MPEASASPGARTRLPGWIPLSGQQASYQLRLLTRSTRSLLAGVLLPVLVLLMRGTGTGGRGDQLALVGGLAALGVISSSFVTHANTLVIARESGVLRRWRMTPLPPSCFFFGKIAATVVVADVSALLIVLVAALTGAPISAAGAAWMLIPMTAGALTWASLGTAVSAFIPTAAAAYPLLTVTYLPIVLVSGALGTVSRPAWLATAATYLPARPVIVAMASALRHAGNWPVLTPGQLGVLAGWVAVGVATALACFRWHPGRARQPRRDIARLRSSPA